MANSGWIAGIVVVVLAVIAFWYFTQPQAQPVITQNNSSLPNVSTVQNNTVPLSSSYNNSDALNDLGVIINPMASILTATSFLNDSNASNVLSGVVSNLTSFESNGNLSTLADKNFFISYAGAVVELANANQDYLNALIIINNQSVTSDLCANKQAFIRGLFFINKSVEEVLNSSAMFNSTLTYPALANATSVNNTLVLLQNFAQRIQKVELDQESNLYYSCG